MLRVTCAFCFFLLTGCGNQTDGGKTNQPAEAPKATPSERAQEPAMKSGDAATASSLRKAPADRPSTPAPATPPSAPAATRSSASEPATLPEVL
jgi:hypothetical protein